jgi:histidinol-phosphate aminotransferase
MSNLPSDVPQSHCPSETGSVIATPSIDLIRATNLTSGFSRRSFMRFAAAASAAGAMPIFSEARLAAQARHVPKVHVAGGVYIDANENPMGPSPQACLACEEIARNGGRYQMDLQVKLAKYFAAQEGLKDEYVYPYAGSSEPLHYTVLGFTGPAKSFVTADPGYEAGIMASKISGATVVKVPLRADHSHDVKAMLAQGGPDVGVFYVCNPNNPTGTTTKREDIEYLVANKPKGSIVLIDEAYIHLSDAAPCTDMAAADKDVVILRTFSKVYGMAGLRCGFAIARPDLLAKVQSFGGWNSMPVTAVAAAQVSLEDKNLVPQRKKIIADIRNETFAWLSANNYQFIPSETNCFMVQTNRPGVGVKDAMAAKNVYIGRVWPVMPTWVRVTVGTKPEMEQFQATFKEVMNSPVMASYKAPDLFDEMPGRFLS